MSTFAEKKTGATEYKNTNLIYDSKYHRVQDMSFKGDIKQMEHFPFYIWTQGITCDDGVDFKITWSKKKKVGTYDGEEGITLECQLSKFWGSH